MDCPILRLPAGKVNQKESLYLRKHLGRNRESLLILRVVSVEKPRHHHYKVAYALCVSAIDAANGGNILKRGGVKFANINLVSN